MIPEKIHFTVSLDTSTYRHALYWNLFCKNKKSTLIMLFLFGCSFFTISYSFLLYKTGSTMFFITVIPALLCMLLPLYFSFKLEKQIKAKAAEIPMEDATRKEITIDDHSLSIYQNAKQTATEYTWHSVKGVYCMDSGLMLYMNDGQIIVMLESQTSAEEIRYTKELAVQNGCLKKALSSKTVIGAFLFIIFAGLYLIVKSLS